MTFIEVAYLPIYLGVVAPFLFQDVFNRSLLRKTECSHTE